MADEAVNQLSKRIKKYIEAKQLTNMAEKEKKADAQKRFNVRR